MNTLNQTDVADELCVAIIDDGVNEERFNTGKLIFNLEIPASLKIQERKNYDAGAPSHGTGCAAIIKKYAPDARIGSIKILNDNHRGLVEHLVKAFKWCISNKIKIVHLSLGTVYFKDFPEIKTIVNTFSESGGVVVAACNNRNIVTYPASLSNVIGVRYNEHTSGQQFFYNTTPQDGIEFSANGRHELSRENKKVLTSPSNSLAAPVITSVVWDILKEKPNLEIEELKEEVYKKAVNFSDTEDAVSCLMHMDWISNAVILNLDQPDMTANMDFCFDVSESYHFNEWSEDTVYDEIQKLICKHPASETMIFFLGEIFRKSGIDRLVSMAEDFRKHLIIYMVSQHEKNRILLKKRGMKRLSQLQIKSFDKEQESQPMDIPVVSFLNTTQKSDSIIIRHISDEFRERGYHSILVSDKMIRMFEGYEFIDTPAGKYLNYLFAIYDPDIMFWAGQSDETFEVDIEVCISDNAEGSEKLYEKEFSAPRDIKEICDFIENTLVNANNKDAKKKIKIHL